METEPTTKSEDTSCWERGYNFDTGHTCETCGGALYIGDNADGLIYDGNEYECRACGNHGSMTVYDDGEVRGHEFDEEATLCSPSYRPFSNGCEFGDWHARNCERCAKGPAPDLQGPNEACDIENAFALASVCGGTINDEVIGDEKNARKIAERLGWDGSGSLPARCSEFLENAKASHGDQQRQPDADQPTSSWKSPETAPRDGTPILGDFGWPWPNFAVWDECDEHWCIAHLQACAIVCPMVDGRTNSWIETDTECGDSLRRWMKMPILPNDKSDSR